MDFFSIDPFAPPTNETLERNLDALSRTSPQAAKLIRAARPREDLELVELESGVWTGAFSDGRRLASARSPITEAERLADTVDVTESAGVCVVGFGIGTHLQLLAERMKKSGVVMCFEPDIALLRAVFEKVDHSKWMLATNFVLLTDPDDGAAISRALSGLEGIIALGVKLIDHPPSRPRIGETGTRFGQRFADVLKAFRTAIVTTLVQSETTLTNLLMNLDHYAHSPGINDLRACALGFPAVIVSAGPSLARNIEVLSRSGVRERVIIICVQTVLKTLLARGIRPHFVCALDHHEISRRFYEGLTPEDVQGVTLVVEPKANPAILDAFPGAIRCIGDELLESIVAEAGLAWQARDTLKPGATVAHLCHYLARYLGCDPVIYVGQDLGFTDGQYYAAGAAIHDVWACELNEFTTLEMREWERIAREKSLLRAREDVFGRRIYIDEQMATYLAQFEADFAADAEAGLRVVDATEGGVAKQHAPAMSLADAIEQFGASSPAFIPSSQPVRHDPNTLAMLKSRLIRIRQDARRVNLLSRDTVRLLKKIRRSGGDVQRINSIVERVHRIRDEVTQLQPAFRLSQFLNQAGTLNRVRADRAINLDTNASPLDQQLQRTERDIRNVEAIAESAQQLCSLLDEAAGVFDGTPKRTRDQITAHRNAKLSRRRVAAVLHIDFEQGGLGTLRSIDNDGIAGMCPVRLTVARLLSARRLREIVCLTDDEPRLRAALGELADRVCYAPLDLDRFRARTRVIGAARRFSASSWRGGIAGLTCFDELFDPWQLQKIMERRNLDAAVLVGPDWCLVDPSLVDAIVERHLEHPDALRLTFTQAPPGLCGVLVDRSAATTLGQNIASAGTFATIGALLGYVPFAPQSDPIARPMCVQIPPSVRDLAMRCIFDTPHARAQITQAVHAMDPIHADASALADALRHNRLRPVLPEHVILELSARPRGGLWGGWLGQGRSMEEPALMPTEAALSIINTMCPVSTLTLHGMGDPLDHPALGEIIAAARSRGIATHLRTMCSTELTAPLSDLDVLSVDVLAAGSETYQHLAGQDAYDRVRERVERMMQERNERAGELGLALPWIVPRITRCDESCEHIEAFYDGWLVAGGCAVIDPRPSIDPAARIQPLPLPGVARERNAHTCMRILIDGSIEGHPSVNVIQAGLDTAWSRVLEERLGEDLHALSAAA